MTFGQGVLNIVIVFYGAMLLGALLIFVERRLLGAWTNRYGPNRAGGPFGVLQIVADLLKLMFKEDWIPPFADRPVFVLAPATIFITVMMSFMVLPVTPNLVISNLNVGLLFFLGMSSLGVYSIVLGGWSSSSKYSLIGGVRAVTQMLSYEVFMGLSLAGIVLISGSFRLTDIVAAQKGLWFVVPQLPSFFIFLFGGIAVLHRLPFDLPEAENELVAGYHTEYSGMKFGLFFMGEYVGIVLISGMISTLFFGGWLGPWLPPSLWFFLKTVFFSILIILLRASLPRPRIDQLLATGWKILLPIALVNILVTGAIYIAIS